MPQKKTICLNMIVKNESKVIARCLASVRHLIDTWVIVDTGSTDGTQKRIRKILEQIPGELHERPWVNFEHNRNEALLLAKNKAHYSLFIDADERLFFSPNFRKPELDKDCYRITVHTQTHCGLRMLMVNNALDWKWRGVLHEEITTDSITGYADFKDVILLADLQDGYRSQDPHKHSKDAELLQKALETDPTNARYTFYLAQSYACAGNHTAARDAYKKRAEMKGPEDEVFWSLYMIGLHEQALSLPENTILGSLWKAHHYQPSRAEPLYSIAKHYFDQGDFNSAYLFSKLALKLPYPQTTGYILYRIYDYELPLLHAEAAQMLGKHLEMQAIYRELLQKKAVPTAVKNKISQILHQQRTFEKSSL